MKIQEFIKQIEHDEIEPVASGSRLGFYCREQERGRFAEPRPAREYEDSNLSNIMRETTRSKPQSPPGWTPEATTARRTGWVIPFPIDILITPREDGRPGTVPGKSYDGITRSYSEKHQLETHNHVEEIDMPWVIDVPEEYSLFYTAPTTISDDRFTVIPGCVDTNGYVTQLTVPFIPLKKQMRINAGTPLIQLYPVRNQDFDVNATINELPQNTT